MKITRGIEVEVSLTVEEIAAAFWSMSAIEQAKFFNTLDSLANSADFVMQLQYISNSTGLHDGGRWIMGKIGEYAN